MDRLQIASSFYIFYIALSVRILAAFWHKDLQVNVNYVSDLTKASKQTGLALLPV